MIQRIQTLWLLISAIASGFLVKGGIVNFSDTQGVKYFTGFSGAYKITGAGNELVIASVPLSVLIILIPVLSILAIFLYKSRKNQKIVTLLGIAFSLCQIILILFYSYKISTIYNPQLLPGIKMILPLLILISLVLAYSGISKDDRVVKSYDRLR